MKRLLLCLVFLGALLFAQTETSVNDSSSVIPQKSKYSATITLLQLSEQSKVPVKKIKDFLDIPFNTPNSKTLAELDIDPAIAEQGIDKFIDKKLTFAFSLTLVGMLVVFISLFVIQLIIRQLQHIATNKPPKAKSAQAGAIQKNIPTEADYSTNAALAAIMALHLHKLEVEEQNKMALTWKRASTSLWKSAYSLTMPNKEYAKLKRS